MELNWSLKEIYTSFNSKEFKGDIEKLTELIEDINTWATETVKDNENVVVKLEEYIKRFSEFTKLISKLGSFAELTVSADTNNIEALKYCDIIETKSTKIVEASTKLEKWISNIEDIDVVIGKSELLKEHEFVLKNIVELSKYLLSDREENIIATMQNTGSKCLWKT